MYLNEIIEIFENSKEIIFLVSTIVGLIFTLVGFYEGNRKAKKKKFIEKYNQLMAQKDGYIKENFEYYLKKYRNEIIESKGLIIKKEWELYLKEYIRNDQLLLLEDGLEVNNIINDNKQKKISPIFPKVKIFPNKKSRYSENLKMFKLSSDNFFNGDLYAASDIDIQDNKVHLNVYESSYYDFYDSCKVLELMYLTNQKEDKLKLNIFDLKNRYAGIGINCLTIFNNVIVDENNKHKSFFLYHKRNNQIMEGIGNIHVVPAGSFQPIKSEILNYNNIDKRKFNENPKNTIYREFCEEIFYDKYMESLMSIDLLKDSIDYKFLEKFAKVYFLGIGLEPYNTKVELLTAMVIDFNDLRAYIEEEQAKDVKMYNLVKEYLDSNESNDLYQLNNLINKMHVVYKEQNKKDTNEYIEGDIHIEEFTKPILEQLATNDLTTVN